MTRIAIGGFLHETNTFAPTKAGYDAFMHGGGSASIADAASVLTTMRDINAGQSGFIAAAEANGWDLVPTIACFASPSAHVTEDAFERIVSVMVDRIAAAGRLDGVYLDLHGAMVTEHLDDGEGEILARVRKVIGPDVPLVASLDLHANVTPEMIDHADALIAYRKYPHTDMADTGRASAQHLALLLKSEQRFAKAFRQLPFLIPISWQCTNDQPARGIYETLASCQSDAVPTLSFAPGFPAADFIHCGPSVFAYGRTQADADAAVDALAALVCGHERDFDGQIYSPDDGVRTAMELAKSATKTDRHCRHPGQSRRRRRFRHHRHAARAGAQPCKPRRDRDDLRSGVGVGGACRRRRRHGDAVARRQVRYSRRCTVRRELRGRETVGRQFQAPGPFYGGRNMEMGPSAALRIGDVRVVLCSHKAQLADQAMYRYVGIEPTEQAILVNKSSVHFRADFEPIAEKLLICAAPGAMPADPATLPWTRLRPGIRLKPNGPAFAP